MIDISPHLDDSFESLRIIFLLIPIRYAAGSLPASPLCAPMRVHACVVTPDVFVVQVV